MKSPETTNETAAPQESATSTEPTSTSTVETLSPEEETPLNPTEGEDSPLLLEGVESATSSGAETNEGNPIGASTTFMFLAAMALPFRERLRSKLGRVDLLKKITTIILFLLSLPGINLFLPQPFKVDFLSGYKIPISPWQGNNLFTTLFLAPLIAFLLSIPFYFVRKSLYKAWLIWSVVWAALPVLGIMAHNPHSNSSFALSPFFLAIPYVTVSLILLLLAFILSRIKNNQERYEARVMTTLKYLALILVLGTILYNIVFYFEKKIRYGKYTFAPFVTQGV